MDTRVCKVCGVEKPLSYADWVCVAGIPKGFICRACNRIKSKQCHAAKRLIDPAWAERRALLNLERGRLLYSTNQDYRLKEIKRGLQKARDNPAMYARAASKRRVAKLNAMPAWLSGLQLADIAKVYAECAKLSASGIQHHVDHIVPLQGKLVCGLHVPWNLQILTASKKYL